MLAIGLRLEFSSGDIVSPVLSNSIYHFHRKYSFAE